MTIYVTQMEPETAYRRLQDLLPDLPGDWGCKDLLTALAKAKNIPQGHPWHPQLSVGISLPNIEESRYLLVGFGQVSHDTKSIIRGVGGDIDDFRDLLAIAAVQALTGEAITERQA